MILYGGGAPKGGGGGSSGSDGGGGVARPVVLKKGPWTAAEDQILAAYVRDHGEGNWNAVRKNTGLARCGKSCRLRWANHLRPNLKKGAFSPDEEWLIIQLHAQLGNKWARMAAQLPGRTDNEIKNYWNTRLKRLQRQGLPLYPPDIVPTYQIQPYQHHHHHHHHHQQQQIYLQPSSQPTTPCSPLASPTPTTPSTAISMAAAASPSSFTSQTPPQLCPHSPTPFPSPTTPRPTSSSPLSPTPPPLSPSLSSPYQYPTLPLFAVPKAPNTTNANNDKTFSFPRPPPLLKQPSLRFKRFNNNQISAHNNTNIVSTASINSNSSNINALTPFLPLTKGSYTSFQTLPHSSPATPTGTTTFHTNQPTVFVPSSSSAHLTGSLSLKPSSFASAYSPNFLQTQFRLSSVRSTDSVYSVKPELPSSQISQPGAIALSDKTNLTTIENQNQNQNNTNLRRSGSGLLEDVLEEAEELASGRGPKRRQVLGLAEENNNLLGAFDHFGSSNTINSSSGLKQKEEESVEMKAVQEDLAKLLDWGSDSREISNGQSSVVTDDNLVLDVHDLASLFPGDPATDEQDKNPASHCWNSLHGNC